jgi:hypothetical protein
LPAGAGFQQVNCAARRGAIKICRTDLQKYLACHFEPSIARQGRLTISDIGVGETRNPQSLQGFLASFEAGDPFVLQQANRKNQNS